MNYQQMFMLLIALVLFTSIAMVANNNLLTQSEFLHTSFYQLQAIQIAQFHIDRIDERLYAESIRISYISNMYDGENQFYLAKENMTYKIVISSAYVDSVGNASSTTTGFYRVDLEVTSEPEVIRPVQISRLYAAF